jgi:hypothetical protein
MSVYVLVDLVWDHPELGECKGIVGVSILINTTASSVKTL